MASGLRHGCQRRYRIDRKPDSGVAAAGGTGSEVAIAGVAGLVAGAMSMAAGEYVSVRSQADTEESDLAREREELTANDASERAELAAIYVSRGLDLPLARQVVDQLMAHDALGPMRVTSLVFPRSSVLVRCRRLLRRRARSLSERPCRF